MKKVIIMSFLILAFTMPFAQANELEKYPSNAEKNFLGADDYYHQVNRSEYTEYPDSVFKLREKVLYKDINKVFSNVPKQFNTTSGVGDGVGYNPKRQVYVFFSAKYVNKKLFSQYAVYDAETGRKISSAKQIL
ncbi:MULTISPECIES: hypothetical protein [unclassified Paenibacillus]|uniref:hypothetical protein n=1 Tax=unclassified Paenibacillus TaxID=185978 RepID=UPI00278628F9|nr:MULTISPECIES: hypothetical protein [unclassified Paenibacillus]MDQ0896431.1 hypothetical protein [Paenibacillus sp. V4I7]MDQ0914025.1 hypothetical protein [Paenibacillus sp. V4I5]